MPHRLPSRTSSSLTGNVAVRGGLGTRCRRGTATVELAICLPVLVTLVFGAIEAANAIYLKQALTEAAYEAARSATASGGSQATAEKRFNEIVTARRLVGTTLAFSPPVSSSTPAGTLIEVTVTAPASANSYAPDLFFTNSILTRTMRMVRH